MSLHCRQILYPLSHTSQLTHILFPILPLYLWSLLLAPGPFLCGVIFSLLSGGGTDEALH